MNDEGRDVEAVVEESSEPVATTRVRRHRGKRWNILAIVAFIAALVASPLAVVFGYISVGQIRRSDQRGETLAWVAVGVGWLWAVLFVVLAVSLGTIWWNNPILWP